MLRKLLVLALIEKRKLGGGCLIRAACRPRRYARFGAKVTQVEMAPRIMIPKDSEVCAIVKAWRRGR